MLDCGICNVAGDNVPAMSWHFAGTLGEAGFVESKNVTIEYRYAFSSAAFTRSGVNGTRRPLRGRVVILTAAAAISLPTHRRCGAAAAEPALHRRHPRQAASRAGWAEEGRRYCGAQRLGSAAMVEAKRVTASQPKANFR
jgi:hypothetical protein